MSAFAIGSRRIGAGQPAFVVAEVGINHCGEVATALKMCEVARDCGADAVKFQTFVATEFCGDSTQLFTYRSRGEQVTEPMLDMFRRHQLPEAAWQEIRRRCDELGIVFFSTPQNATDLDLLLGVGVPAIKIGSDDFVNVPLLRRVAAAKLPVILSCGMSDIGEVQAALEATGWFEGSPVAVLACTSSYPTPAEDVHIAKLGTLQAAFPGLVVGFSDHSQGPLASALAIAAGAGILEKHFTLDRDMPGPDHWFSEDPASLRIWIETIRLAERMMGRATVRPTPAELKMRVLARRSIVALREIAAGDVFTEQNIGLRRPGDGLTPALFEVVLGKRARQAVRSGKQIGHGDIET